MESRDEASSNRTPPTFADAAEAWLLHGERKRALKRSTLADYRQTLDAYLLPSSADGALTDSPYGRAPFATTPVHEIRSTELEEWYERLPTGRTAEKLLMIVRAVLGHARSLAWTDTTPIGGSVERQHVSVDADSYSDAEIGALVQAAANAQDAAIFLTAATTGLRLGELIALRWRDIDPAGPAIRVRASFGRGELVTQKSGKVRSVPLAAEVAAALSDLQLREPFADEHAPVFTGPIGGRLDPSAVRRRYTRAAKRAGLRPLPFRSLRHDGSIGLDRAARPARST